MIPFVLLAASTFVGTIGVLEGVEGIDKLSKARRIVKRSEEYYRENYSLMQSSVAEFNKKLESLGLVKQELHQVRKEIKKTIEDLQKRVKFKEILIHNEKLDINAFTFELNEEIEYTEEILKGLLKATGSSFLTYFGAIGIATSVGTASTGTAIASLSGAAAENAILAWFGGGALAAGGGGMALGTVVLSGIVAGPGIFFVGVSLSKAGEKALTQAKKVESKVKLEVRRMEILRKEIQKSSKLLQLYRQICSVFKDRAFKLIAKASTTVDEEEIRRVIVDLVLVAKGINELLQVNVLEKCGFRLTENAKSVIDKYSYLL